jgi:hypothetical protein
MPELCVIELTDWQYTKNALLTQANRRITMKTLKILVALASLAFVTHAHAAGAAGEITLLKGRATVTQDGKPVRLYMGASVIVGDQLKTAKGARLRLRMIDGTEIWLGENTDFTVREYSMNEESGVGSLELVKGFFRAITGKMTKLKQHQFQVKTPLAVIGVRGTDFWGAQSPDRLRVALLGGTAIIISNDAGTVEITEVGLGTEITKPGEAPREPFRWSPEELKRAAGTVL